MKQEYVVPDFEEKPKDSIRLLSFDPGSVNMGCSLLEINRSTKSISVLADTVLMHPLHDIKRFRQEQSLFISEVKSWIENGKPDAIIAERFQSRGLKGLTIECVCMMLGLLSMLDLPVLYITAATWKNRYQKRFKIDLREIYKEIQVAPHQLDSALIGCFGAETGLKSYIDFSIDDIITQVTDKSLVPLKIRKRWRQEDENA